MFLLMWVTRSSFILLSTWTVAVHGGLTLAKEHIQLPNRLLISRFDLRNPHAHGSSIGECLPIPQRSVKKSKGTTRAKQFTRLQIVTPARI